MENNFAEILKEFLDDKHLTQVDFAEKVGVKQGQVSEWYNGVRAMAKAYNVSADYFLGLKEDYCVYCRRSYPSAFFG